MRRLARKSVASGTALATGLVLSPFAALALPVGGQVVGGQASVSQSTNTLNVTQTSTKAVLDWQSFSIGAGETVNFQQPGTSSIALNRVTGSNASAIYGHLNANGQVFLVNPNGVYFAPGAKVNVGGLVAATLGISSSDFLAGKYHFSGTSTKGVVNDGSINAAPGGYVALIGNSVDNQGSITTPGGTTALGAGGTVDLTLAGNQLLHFQVSAASLDAAVKNGGAIKAGNGAVILSARSKNAVLQTVVNNTGVILAQGVRKGRGGTIELFGGNTGTVAVSGRLDASAPTGTGGKIVATGRQVVAKSDARLLATGAVSGGEIAVGGGWQGGGNIAQAQQATVERGAVLDASGTGTGSGGQISVWSNVHDAASVICG